MDIEKMIEQLKYYGTTYAIGDSLGREIEGSDELMLNAATALSTLQAENEKLRADLARVTAERDAAISDLERETFGTPPGFTQRYGEPGTLSCHFGPCNGRNVNANDFCSYGQRKEDE